MQTDERRTGPEDDGSNESPAQGGVSLLLDIVLGISSSLDLESTLNSIVRAAALACESETSSIWLWTEDGHYAGRAAFGIDLEVLRSIRLEPDKGLIARMRASGEAEQVVDFGREVVTSEDALQRVAVMGVHATAGVPLRRDGEVIGALYVGRRASEPFSAAALGMLQQLALFAQVSLTNAERFSHVEAERVRLQAYLDAIPEGVIIFDRDAQVRLINQALERELGGRPSTLGSSGDAVRQARPFPTRTVRFRYDPEAVFQRVLTTGKPEQGLLEMEDPAATFEINFNALRNSGGEIDGVVATLRDITLPLELERERSRSTLMAQLLDLSAGLNSNLSIPALTERVVEAAMELIGAQSGMIGLVEGDALVFRRIASKRVWTDVDIRAKPGEGLGGHVWKTGKPYVSNDREHDLQLGLGPPHGFHFRRSVVVPVINRSGAITGTLHVHDPIIERDFERMDVEMVQLLANQAAISIENARLNDLKDEFLSIVSHELKTPVTSIKGFTQVLQRRLPPETLEQSGRYLRVLNQQADRLGSLINDLLDLSRIQRGQFSFELKPMLYSELVQNVVEEMQLVGGEHEIFLESPDGLVVQGNPNRLQQVLVNLIDNAFKYGPSGGAVRVTVEECEDEIATYVGDEGPGLPADEAERIFSLYYQVPYRPARAVRGIGLGLYVSRQIVEGHGGRIWLDPVGHTSFCFTIPRTRPA